MLKIEIYIKHFKNIFETKVETFQFNYQRNEQILKMNNIVYIII